MNGSAEDKKYSPCLSYGIQCITSFHAMPIVFVMSAILLAFPFGMSIKQKVWARHSEIARMNI